ncbi:isoprenoid synthase domain-containing protein [Polychytrium aggregatum]|uniref:isoprenoid synthase domain-containing protein n=1 Tax=Polychytrium aggregatum TaxID=110093 RepID=UPI0022FDC494|nr:isoprenoid synthase domain-containing protein [Polychytrium aggregatum]KAI9203095.1 isoprenoid synthase domain-containing protein [Polychytrium aggregatum]
MTIPRVILRGAVSASGRTFATQSTSADANTARYCSDLVRRYDYDHYLASIFVPAQAREAYWAIRSLNIELSLVHENVKEIAIRKMRLQWWRDALDLVYKGQPPNQPVAQALAKAVAEGALSRIWLKRLIDEREKRLTDVQFGTLHDLEQYAENTAGSLINLQIESLGLRDLHADHAASHIGKAIGIVTMLRGTPFHIQSRQFYLPSEVTAKHGIVTEELFRHGPSDRLADAVFEIATLANDHMITARSFAKEIPHAAYPALLGTVTCDVYLKKLERVNFNLFDKSLFKKDLVLPFKLWRSSRTGVF